MQGDGVEGTDCAPQSLARAVPIAGSLLSQTELTSSGWIGSEIAAIERRRVLADYIMQSASETHLGELFPMLRTNQAIAYNHSDAPVRKCFQLYGKIYKWSEFCKYSVRRLLTIDGAEPAAVHGFLEAAIRQSAQAIFAQSESHRLSSPDAEIADSPDLPHDALTDSERGGEKMDHPVTDAGWGVSWLKDCADMEQERKSPKSTIGLVASDNDTIKQTKPDIELAASVPTGMLGWTTPIRDSGPVIELIEHWASSRRRALTFGDVFQLSSTLGDPAPSLQKLWQHLAGMPLPIDSELILEPVACAWRILSGLEERDRQVFYWRVLVVPQLTLEQVGARLNLTRERVRQLEKALEGMIRQQLVSPANHPLCWMLDDLRGNLGIAFREEWLEDLEDVRLVSDFIQLQTCRGLDDSLPSEVYEHTRARIHLEHLLEFVLWLAGPYSFVQGWLVNKPKLFSGLESELARAAKESVGLPVERALEILADAGLTERARLAFLAEVEMPKLRRIDEVLYPWSGTVADKAEVILAIVGRPASDAELVEMIGEGHARQSLRNRLFQEQRFMRVDRDLFALRSWGLEEYSGISQEIAERIERSGGEAIFEDVVEELLRTFDISESSIRQYAATPRFIREDGRIRLREDLNIVVEADDPLSVAGVYRPGPNRLRWAVDVTDDTLRGSGRGIPVALAVALGLSPGHEQAYDWRTGHQLRVLWRLDSPSGPELGSIAVLVSPTGVSVGDQVVLEFDTEHHKVAAERVPPGSDIEQITIALTGLRGLGGPLESLGRALDVDPGSVRAVLRRRGDDHLLTRLPTPEVDDQLRTAISDLTEFLGQWEDS